DQLGVALPSRSPSTTVPVFSATSLTPRPETRTLRREFDHTGKTKECVPGPMGISQGAGGSIGRTPVITTRIVVREGAVTTILSYRDAPTEAPKDTDAPPAELPE